MIWVEILDRHRNLVARHRCEGDAIRIGRGYDNDVIVDDPFVAANHLCVFRDEAGRLVAEDLGSAGGIYLEGGGRQSRVIVDGERPLRIGRTLLHLRQADHPVAPERIVPATRSWPAAAALALAVVALETLSQWLSETTEFKVTGYVLPLGVLVTLTLVWTSGWTVLARIFAGHARFERHLTIALAALLGLSLFDEAVDAGAFAFSWRLLANYAYVGAWLITATACFFHLREIAPTRLRLEGAVVFALGAAAVAAQTLAQSEIRPWLARGSYLRELRPPFFRVVQPQDDAAFFAGAERLRPSLERARKDEASGPDLPW
ncbi:MAG: FHA domain-containing protein, partial [Deltaproteobacteria bacterium]|nr:FHA domain-containing protein [Deltaproteobacteria bacterium]